MSPRAATSLDPPQAGSVAHSAGSRHEEPSAAPRRHRVAALGTAPPASDRPSFPGGNSNYHATTSDSHSGQVCSSDADRLCAKHDPRRRSSFSHHP